MLAESDFNVRDTQALFATNHLLYLKSQIWLPGTIPKETLNI